MRMLGMVAAGAAAAVAGVVRFDDFDVVVAIFLEEVEDPGRCGAGQSHDGEPEQQAWDEC